MSKREAQLWKQIRPMLAPLDPVRVENPVHPGTPDVNLTTGWVELKCADRPHRTRSIVRVPHFTPQQRVWLLRRWRAGGRAWMFLKLGDGRDASWFLIPGDLAASRVGLVDATSLCVIATQWWHARLIDSELLAALSK